MKRAALLLSLPLAFVFTTSQAQAQDDENIEVLPPEPNTPAPAPPPKVDGSAPQKGEEDPATTQRLSFRGALGYQYLPIHGVPVTGARARIGIGTQNDSSAHYAMLSLHYGGTSEGLTTYDAKIGWTGDFLRKGIFRLGVDVEMGYLWIDRATIDKRMWALGLGAAVHASVDLYAFGPRNDHALMIEGRFEGEVLFGPALKWGPTLLVGMRY